MPTEEADDERELFRCILFGGAKHLRNYVVQHYTSRLRFKEGNYLLRLYRSKHQEHIDYRVGTPEKESDWSPKQVITFESWKQNNVLQENGDWYITDFMKREPPFREIAIPETVEEYKELKNLTC